MNIADDTSRRRDNATMEVTQTSLDASAVRAQVTVTVRPAAVSPTESLPLTKLASTISTDPHSRIHICHPHYPTKTNVIFDLFAPDHPDGGLQYDFVMVACGVVADNRWDGWLTETLDGPALSILPDEVLRKGRYYFFLPDSTSEHPYPVVPSFKEWEFPHENMPPSWTSRNPPTPTAMRLHPASSLYPNLLLRDNSCRMSACVEGSQVAHICPRSEEEWFMQNLMSFYQLRPPMGNARSIDDAGNAMLLRADLHQQFDACKYVFYPKSSSSLQPPDRKTEFVTHMLVPSYELGTLYHNAALQPISGVQREFLFARFAWTIFPLMEDFLRRGVPLYLTGVSVKAANGGLPSLVQPLECRQFVTKTLRSGSQSPKKRGRSEGGTDNGSFPASRDSEGYHQHKKHKVMSDASLRKISSTESALEPQTPEWSLEWHRMAALREQWLLQERSRSDPGRRWEDEEAWVDRMRNDDKTALGPAEAKRYHEHMGLEFRNEADGPWINDEVQDDVK